MTHDVAPGTHTIGFEHRHLGYRGIVYGSANRSHIEITELPQAELHSATRPVVAAP